MKRLKLRLSLWRRTQIKLHHLSRNRRMKMHMLICVFVVVLPMVHGVAGNMTQMKRFKMWLQARLKRDLHPEPQQDPELDRVPLRSPRSASGCVLSTCALPAVIEKIHEAVNRPILSTAPKDKMGPKGYGRRRRRHSPLDMTRVGRGEA